VAVQSVWRWPTETCPARSDAELAAAAAILGASLVLAVQSALKVESSRASGLPPTAPHLPGFDREVWAALQTMLSEERRLIEFIVGPKTRNGAAGSVVTSNPDDICIMCFATDAGDRWDLDAPLRTRLRSRASRINKRISHFAWVLTEPDARTERGTWQTGYLRAIVTQFSQFVLWLHDQRPESARALEPYVERALMLANSLPVPDPNPWFAE
jgi:hypothetical protein